MAANQRLTEESLTITEVIDKVFQGLKQGEGKQIKRRMLKERLFILNRDSDWHRTDTCWANYRGVILETGSREGILLVKAERGPYKIFLSDIKEGIRYAPITTEDQEQIWQDVADWRLGAVLDFRNDEAQWLLVNYGGKLYCQRKLIPDEFVLSPTKHDPKAFRGRGMFQGVILVPEIGESEIPEDFSPMVSKQSTFKKEVVPYLVAQIKEHLKLEN